VVGDRWGKEEREYPITNSQCPLEKWGIRGFRRWRGFQQGQSNHRSGDAQFLTRRKRKGAEAPHTKATKVARFSFGKSPDGALLEERKEEGNR